MKINKLISLKLTKWCLTVASVALLSQTVWACEKSQIRGYDDVSCLSESLVLVKKTANMALLIKWAK